MLIWVCDFGFPSHCRHLVYFGANILHTIVPVLPLYLEKDIIALDRIINDDNTRTIQEFKNRIKAHLNIIAQVLKRPYTSSHIFERVKDNFYIYQYPNPPAKANSHEFSHILLSNLVGSGLLEVSEDCNTILPHDLNHSSHWPMELFLRSKVTADFLYQQLLARDNIGDEERHQLEMLLVENKGDPAYPDVSLKYIERTWTRRLYSALKLHCSDLSPKLTMDQASGGGFAKNILTAWSRIAMKATCVPFRGAPDITTNSHILNVLGGDDEDSDSGAQSDATDTTPLELSTGLKLTIARGTEMCPEKLGELSAAMLIKGFCHMVKDLVHGKVIPGEYIVHGTLLNKMSGEALQCVMKVPCTLVDRLRHTTRHLEVPLTTLSVQLQAAVSSGELCQAVNYFRTLPDQ